MKKWIKNALASLVAGTMLASAAAFMCWVIVCAAFGALVGFPLLALNLTVCLVALYTEKVWKL